MKLIALIALLLISNCVAISFVSAVDDFAWQVAVSHDSSIIASDLKLISKFAENKDLIFKEYPAACCGDRQETVLRKVAYSACND